MRGDNIKIDLKEIWRDTMSWTKLVGRWPQLSEFACYRNPTHSVPLDLQVKLCPYASRPDRSSPGERAPGTQ
jgi:hypothetical protein